MKIASIMEDLIVWATSGQGDRPAGNYIIRFGTVNADRISGRENEVVEMLTRWRGGSAYLVKGKGIIYRFFWSGDQSGFGGAGIMLAE